MTRWTWRRARQSVADGGRRLSRRRLAAVAGVAAVALGAGALATSAALPSGKASPARHDASSPAVSQGNPGKTGEAQASGGLTPKQVRAAYDLPPLNHLSSPGALKGITGKGETIVVVDSFGSPTITRDLARFDKRFGVPAPPSFRVIQPAGAVPPFHASNSNRDGWAAETSLDVEWAHAIAPGASILLVETPTSENEGTTGFPQIVAAEKYVLRRHEGAVISQSFAATEQTFPSRSGYAALKNLRGAYQMAARDHVTVLAATGDEGATSYKYNMVDLYPTRAVSWPATDPLVTAVGGTQLDLRTNGTRIQPDVAWSGSGGGRSLVFGRPSYQNSVKSLTGDHRGVPDISMDASCNSQVAIYSSFQSPGGLSTICGTSLATPLFAGIVALADQYAGHPLGLINAAIYKMEARHEPGIVDVTRGNNSRTFSQGGKRYTVSGFGARKGYDLVSGVGTVNARYFVPELAALAG